MSIEQRPPSLAETLSQIAAEAGVSADFPPEVHEELARVDLQAALADPALVDWTALAFVTIDGPTSKDLDQALFVEPCAEGFLVRYALADAAHFVPKHGALFEQALLRAASVYLPGFSVPMLPRELSEGVVSLNPDGPRRALSFEVRIDPAGNVLQTRVLRTRIASRAKLSFPDVQSFYDGAPSALHGHDYTPSLLTLREVGRALVGEARRRDVARYRRQETAFVVQQDARGEQTLQLMHAPRLDVELYNEQLSLLVNREGARLLAESGQAHVEPIYRVHPAPAEERKLELQAVLDGVVSAHGLDESWRFVPEREPLSEYLLRLPTQGQQGRIADAIHRQAVLVNTRSSFSTDRAGHHGVGAEAYARFSAPMREVVGVFVHHEMLELLTATGNLDATLRARVVEAANRSKVVQRKVNELVFRHYLDGMLGADLALPLAERPRRLGTVVGITGAKVHVALDAPQVDVKLYVRDLGRAHGAPGTPAWLLVTDGGAVLREREQGTVVARVGDAVHVVLEGHDPRQNRWMLQLDGPTGNA